MSYEDFTFWIAEKIFENEVNDNPDCFCELACRKLEELGVIEAREGRWIFTRARGNL